MKGVIEMCYIPLQGRFIVLVPCNSPCEGGSFYAISITDAKTKEEALKMAAEMSKETDAWRHHVVVERVDITYSKGR